MHPKQTFRSIARRRAMRCVLAALAGGALAVACGSPSSEEAVRTVHVPTPPPASVLTDTLRPGQTLGHVFGTFGFDNWEIARLVELVREHENPRRLRPGTVYHLAMRPAEPPTRVSVRLDPDRTLHLFAGPDQDAWSARLDSVPVYTDTVVVGGVVESNLYNARLVGDTDRLSATDTHDLVYRLSQVFGWQVDFYRDIRSGDAYRVALERQVRPDGTVRSVKMLAAEYVNAGRKLSAIRFQETEDDQPEFFAVDGQALRSQFLRAPLDLVRITSGFNMRRYHPILKRRRPHLGTDYGARAGTPVRATGAGVVTRAGWWGGYGRVVEIRHANNLRTRYAHLRGIARGVRSGTRVQQGQTIGYVGATGLATAPHLHYEFLRHGRHVNPARLNLPRAEPVGAEYRERFEAERDAALIVLHRVELPGLPALQLARGPEADDDDPGRIGD